MKNSMNIMINRIQEMNEQKDSSAGEIREFYAKKLEALKLNFDKLYGRDLEDRLFDIYDDLCPDDEIKNILDYFCIGSSETSGIIVYAYDFPGVSSEITIKTSPLRIELSGLKSDFTEVVWTAAA